MIAERVGAVAFPQRGTILEYVGVLANFEMTFDSYRERAIRAVAEEYARGKHDAYLILKILTGDSECVEYFISNKCVNDQYHISPLTIMETVKILERTYHLDKSRIAEIIAALLNTPIFLCDLDHVFRKALNAYARRNLEFRDAVMVYWGFWSESLESFYCENRLY